MFQVPPAVLHSTPRGATWDPGSDEALRGGFTCLHSLRHSAEMASSQQPSPTQPSDFRDTPATTNKHTLVINHHYAV